jgi:hypothetical protein
VKLVAVAVAVNDHVNDHVTTTSTEDRESGRRI